MNEILLLYSSRSGNNVNVNKRITITIRQDNYQRLKSHGKYGDSFNTLLGRILDQVEKKDQKN